MTWADAEPNGPPVLACAIDDGYGMPLAVTLRSVLDHLPRASEARIFALSDGVLPETRDRVQRSLGEGVAPIEWVSGDRVERDGLPLWGRMPLTTYAKVFMAEWLPREVSRALWLDADLLAVGDVTPLWELDTGQDVLLAVPDPFVPSIASRFGVAGWREWGLPGEGAYFNAGVMLADLEGWREHDVAGVAMRYLTEFGDQVFFWDQEALNAAMHDRWGHLDPRWNWSVSVGRLGRSAEHRQPADPVLVHFSGTMKPWDYEGTDPLHRAYYAALDATAWSGWRPPRSLRGTFYRLYDSSRLRRLLHPLEEWGLEIQARRTRRRSTPGEAGTP